MFSGFFIFTPMVLSWQIVRFQLKETFAIAYGNYSYREALLVTLSHAGLQGYGECTAIDYYNISLEDFNQKLHESKAIIEQQKIEAPVNFYAFLLQLNLPSFLRSALDCAYWDLFGKLENKSFLELNKIEVNALPESSITISVDSVENQIQKIQKSTWNKFKVKCNHLDENAISKLVALERDMALDSNGSFTKEECLRLENNEIVSRFSYLEQPMKPGTDNYKILHAGTYANWMADEDCQDLTVLKKLLPHYNSVNIKLVKCGGLTPALEMIASAKASGYKIMIGCMTESSIGISAGAVLAPFCDFADLDGANLIVNDLATGSQVVNGKIHLSEKPGLGIKLI
ncbi:enolase C-terminal domain-like protein [Flavobacterium sp. XGLA_31]|uniref:enolase C-terminal domain-like protein n=1 Tax=Flavobacterium sp. XGLA_31 TaxID=3447666 RepID=UPI003F3DD0EA